MDRPRTLCRPRNRRGPPWDYRCPERARPGHHVYGDVAPRSPGGNAPRLKRRQQRTTRNSTSFSHCFCPISPCLLPGSIPTLLHGCRGCSPSSSSVCTRETEHLKSGPKPGTCLALSLEGTLSSEDRPCVMKPRQPFHRRQPLPMLKTTLDRRA